MGPPQDWDPTEQEAALQVVQEEGEGEGELMPRGSPHRACRPAAASTTPYRAQVRLHHKHMLC